MRKVALAAVVLGVLGVSAGGFASVAQAAARPLSSRIIGAAPASAGTWPWLAFIQNSPQAVGMIGAAARSSRPTLCSQPVIALWT